MQAFILYLHKRRNDALFRQIHRPVCFPARAVVVGHGLFQLRRSGDGRFAPFDVLDEVAVGLADQQAQAAEGQVRLTD